MLLRKIRQKINAWGTPSPAVASPRFEVRICGDGVELKYRVTYLGMKPTHRPIYRTLRLPAGFYEKRQHIFEAVPKVTNHDPLAFLLFTKVCDEIQKETITVAEFGVWRGAFLENLAIHACETGKKLLIYGFDTFDEFPDTAVERDLRSRTPDNFNKFRSKTRPFTKSEIHSRLAKYQAVEEFNLIAGDITKLETTVIRPDIVHYDMDYYQVFFAAMQRIGNIQTARLIIDDYYQPSWPGMVDAVNEFCSQHNLYPVNLSDYFRIERSHRTQFTVILLPLSRIGVDATVSGEDGASHLPP